MRQSIDAEEYEADFLRKYIKKDAEKKRKKLQQKLEELDEEKDTKKINEIKNKILEIENDLETGLTELIKPTEFTKQTEKIIEVDTNFYENDNNFDKFLTNYNIEKEKYCIKYSIKPNEFMKHLFSSAVDVEGLKVPLFIYEKLFPFQKDSLKWLYSVFKKEKGGILADEMGLGKTIQIISFISSLYVSNLLDYALIVTPLTILDHWTNEFKKFFPFLRICIFHKDKSFDLLSLLNSFIETKGILILSYEGLKQHFYKLKQVNFNIIILDEGHKIKNQKSFISQFAKELKCKSKIVLSGTPMQNNLAELWNLIDFSVPNLLGKYETFKNEFEEKIKKGGYKNATNEDVMVATDLSKYLKKLISPYFLRRTKREVAQQLPKKEEKVYFCGLTETQEILYKRTLNTEQMFDVLTGKRSALWGIDLLRKICNHPFLLKKDYEYLEEENLIFSSGKMVILDSLLNAFKKEKKKVLIFTQTISMMNILEKYCRIKRYSFIKMNGKTNLKERKALIQNFNKEDIFVFLLTTKVGGLGVNLSCASRVIIYDPDWNPSSDNQAKERVYRYGQTDDVIIYKLITNDTIEEKILHTQIFKNLLHQKIFSNASLSRFFNKIDLDDLFTYSKNTSKRNKIENALTNDYEITFLKEEEENSDLEQFILEREKDIYNEETLSNYEDY